MVCFYDGRSQQIWKKKEETKTERKALSALNIAVVPLKLTCTLIGRYIRRILEQGKSAMNPTLLQVQQTQ